jgi:hypothetical protein
MPEEADVIAFFEGKWKLKGRPRASHRLFHFHLPSKKAITSASSGI